MSDEQHRESRTLDALKKPLKQALWVVVGFSAAINLLMLALPLYSLQVLDRVVSSGSHETLLMLTVLITFLLLAFGVFSALRDMVLSGVSRWLDGQLNGLLVYSALDDAAIKQRRLPSQNLQDLETVKRFIYGPALKTFCDAPWSIVFLIVIYMIHPYLAILTGVCSGIIFGIAYLNEKLVTKRQQRVSQKTRAATQQLDQFTSNVSTIRAMRMHETLKSIWNAVHKQALQQKHMAQVSSAWTSNSAKTFRMIVQMLTTGLGAYLTLQGQMTVGGMIAASILASRVLAPFEVAIMAWAECINARSSYKILRKVVQHQDEQEETPMNLPEPKGELAFENVSFRYREGEKPVLQGVSFSIKPGEVLAVIGPSASGKSTLAALAAGIYPPVSGHVRFDGADIARLNQQEMGAHIGYLPQAIELFHGSIKQNIARMALQPSEDEVIAAAQATNTHKLILGLPQGYETMLSPHASNLSAGQKQRVGLTRALYQSPRLLILDEPDAHLDDEGNLALIKALKEAKKKKMAVIVITHHPSLLKVCDNALVLNKGRVADYDTVEAISAKYRPAPKKKA